MKHDEPERPPSYAEMQHHHEPDVPTWFVLTALLTAIGLIVAPIATVIYIALKIYQK